jgi:threonine dehydrogenase-like Zn-dependent dehydrogenase
MQELRYTSPRTLTWVEVPEPTITVATDAIVRPLAVSRCDLDVAIIDGHPVFTPPFGLGHEFVAEVVEVGDDVSKFGAGDLVVVPFTVACGWCEACRRHQPIACQEAGFQQLFGMGSVGGGQPGALADLVRVPYADGMFFHLPPELDLVTMASCGDNMSDGYRCVAPLLADHPRASVAVLGGSGASIGLYAALFAQVLGAEVIEYFDTDPGRLTIAEGFGVSVFEGPAPTTVNRYDIVVNASGTEAGMKASLASLAPAGCCTATLPYYEWTAEISVLDLFTKGATLKAGGANTRVHIRNVLDVAQRCQPLLRSIVTTTAPWEAAAEAFLAPGPKVVVHRERMIGSNS